MNRSGLWGMGTSMKIGRQHTLKVDTCTVEHMEQPQKSTKDLYKILGCYSRHDCI